MNSLPIPPDIFPEPEIVAFGVTGDCMNGAGILDGDHVIVDTSTEVQDGDIAVVRSRWGDLVKQVYRVDGKLIMVPSNSAYQPFILRWTDFPVIVGKVIGIHREPDIFTRL
jgi:repressor LexA